MAYAWTQNAESQRAERIPKGKHRVRVLKCLRTTQNGEAFVSNNGDPQLLLVFQDPQAREVSYMFTLSDRAAFRLAQFMSCCDPPINLAQLEADGVEPGHFADEEWARANFENRQLTIDVIPNPQDERYPHIEFVKVRGPEAAPPAPAAAATPAARPAPQRVQTPPPAAQTATRPPVADEPPPPAEEPPPPAAEPQFANKDQAWRHVLEQWVNRTQDEPGKLERNKAWQAAVREVSGGRTESQLTPADWTRVVDICGTPF